VTETGPRRRRGGALAGVRRLGQDLDRKLDAGVAAGERREPAWLRQTPGEHRFPVIVVVVVAVALQALLPHPVLFAPRWVLLIPETALLVAVVVGNPVRLERDSRFLRGLSLALTGLVSGSNAVSAVLLVRDLVSDHSQLTDSPGTLLASGGLIYATNVLAFGLWYWELDRGGPIARRQGRHRFPDLLFPQMSSPDLAPPEWEPTVLDYLYVSFTNATAFSPTDTMPMTRWTKLLMLVQSAVALVVVGLVIARAVNVLK
jgi:hypothetical protein